MFLGVETTMVHPEAVSFEGRRNINYFSYFRGFSVKLKGGDSQEFPDLPHRIKDEVLFFRCVSDLRKSQTNTTFGRAVRER